LKPALQGAHPKPAQPLTLSSDTHVQISRGPALPVKRGEKIQALAEARLSIFTNTPCVLYLGWEPAAELVCPSQLRSIALLSAHNLVLETNSTNLVLPLPHRM